MSRPFSWSGVRVVAPVGRQDPTPLAFRASVQLSREDRIELAAQRGIVDRRHHLDPPPKIPRPPVGRSDVVLGAAVASVGKMIDPGMLEKAAQNAHPATPFGYAGHAGSQRAE